MDEMADVKQANGRHLSRLVVLGASTVGSRSGGSTSVVCTLRAPNQ